METVVATPQPGSTPLLTEQPPSTGPVATTAAGESGSQLQPGSGALQLPSAAKVGDCGLPPIAVAQGPVNVRSGPGIEYETIANLVYQDERVIVGRAANEAWWQILLSAEQLGWVSDPAVTVVGYIGAVPITFEGQSGASQPLWNPTPNPGCTPPSEDEIAVSEGQLAAAVLVDRPTADPDRAPTPIPDDGLADASAPGFSPLTEDASASGVNLIWLPIVGAILIIAGGIVLLAQRWQR